MQFHPDRVLCVEDDESTCQIMKVLPGMWNDDVALAQTAADGFRLMRSERFDLCLLDTSFPNQLGFEPCGHICELDGPAPVAFISGHVHENDQTRGLKAGALASLTKPVDFDFLKETMGRLIDETSSRYSLAA